jgi:hypothetical protein
MKKRVALRNTSLAVLILVALGTVGYLAEGQTNATTGGAGLQEPAMDDANVDVMGSIDKALGRQTSPAQPVPQNSAADRQAIGPMPPLSIETKPGAAQAGPGGGPTAPNEQPATTTQDRKIVQTAALRLQVKEVGGSFEEVGRIAAGAGGFVASSNFSYVGEQQVASVTIRVPSARYQEVLGQLRALSKKVDGETSNASDITEEYSDYSARLRNLEATEAQLVQFLGQAKNIGEVLQVQDRLNSVRSEIERVKGRIALLDKLSDMATITTHLRPVGTAAGTDTGGTNLGSKVSEAWQASLDFLAAIAGVVITVIVFGWWLPLVAVPLALFGSRWLRNRPSSVTAVD